MLPSKLDILGHIYTLFEVDNCFSESNNEKLEIFIKRNLKESVAASAMLKECLSIIDERLAIGIDDLQIDALQSGIFQLLQNNGDSFLDVFGESVKNKKKEKVLDK